VLDTAVIKFEFLLWYLRIRLLGSSNLELLITTKPNKLYHFRFDKDADNGLLKLMGTCLRQFQFHADIYVQLKK